MICLLILRTTARQVRYSKGLYELSEDNVLHSSLGDTRSREFESELLCCLNLTGSHPGQTKSV